MRVCLYIKNLVKIPTLHVRTYFPSSATIPVCININIKHHILSQANTFPSWSFCNLPTTPTDFFFSTLSNETSRYCRSGAPYDHVITKRVEKMISEDKRKEAVEIVKTGGKSSVYPCPKVLLKLLSFSSFAGDEDDFKECCEVYKKAYSDIYYRNTEFSHYLAQILWKNKQYTESLKLFTNLILKDDHLKGKVIDLMKFFVKHVLNDCSVDNKAYAQDLFDVANNFVEFRATQAAIMIWKELFIISDVEIQQLAYNLLQRNECLTKLITHKVDGIIHDAWFHNRIDILQRLIELVLFYDDMTKLKTKVFSALVDFQCMNNDLRGILETIKHIANEKIIIKSEVIRHAIGFLSYHEVRVPAYLLQCKHSSIRSNMKYHF